MLENIKNLENVQLLSKTQMKSVNGAGYLTNYQCTGRPYYNTTGAGDGPTGWECTAQYQRTFIGMDWGKAQLLPNQVFPCPAGMQC